MVEKILYANNQKEAMEMFRKQYPNYVPIKAKYAGTKHGARVYIVMFKERRVKSKKKDKTRELIWAYINEDIGNIDTFDIVNETDLFITIKVYYLNGETETFEIDKDILLSLE